MSIDHWGIIVLSAVSYYTLWINISLSYDLMINDLRKEILIPLIKYWAECFPHFLTVLGFHLFSWGQQVSRNVLSTADRSFPDGTPLFSMFSSPACRKDIRLSSLDEGEGFVAWKNKNINNKRRSQLSTGFFTRVSIRCPSTAHFPLIPSIYFVRNDTGIINSSNVRMFTGS